MYILDRAFGLWQSRAAESPRPRRFGLALAGGGVVGGMYEVGALAALEERLDGGCHFEIYVGCSAGSVVASILANGISPSQLYRILDQDLDDPLNFGHAAVYASNAFRQACGRFGRVVWAVGKNVMKGRRGSIPDMLGWAERDLPAGFFSLIALEGWIRGSFAARGMSNTFRTLPRTLLIPAVDLDRAERVVFGGGDLVDVPVSQAIAASSAIPGFFEPYPIGGRDYVDGGVGFCGHADLAVEAGADTVLVINPLVPTLLDGADASMRSRGLYTIMEQASRIYSQNLLQLGLSALAIKHPHVSFFLLQPPRTDTPLFGQCMGFEASRAALRFGYTSTRAWLDTHGQFILRSLVAVPQAA
jgi:NTE family protein